MIKQLFVADLYIKVGKNRIEAKNLSNSSQWITAIPETPFTTHRLLVGQFSAAEPLLTKLVKQLTPKGLLKKSARMVLHPVVMVDGGLCEVEERIFTELGLGSGAHKVKLHTGSELSAEQAIALLNQ